MSIIIVLIAYCVYLGLSINFVGVVLRIFLRMVSVVIVFAFASMPVLVIIAYPIHTLYLDFDQRADGQVFP